MNNYPIPMPDRRSIHKEKTYPSKIPTDIASSYPNNIFRTYSQTSSNKRGENDEDFEFKNTMTVVKLKQIEDMRQKILSVKLLSDKSHYLSSESEIHVVNRCNMILFGPSGSGKSSFIKSLYQALYNTPILPPDPLKKLIVKGAYENEGTLHFTRLHLKEESNESSGIVLCDTRGHIKRNDREKEQFKVMIEGNIKQDALVEQRRNRNSMALWEFWKSSNELFPKEIYQSQKTGITSIPHSIVLVFDGSSDKVISDEDFHFYKDLVSISKRKGYSDIHVILTRVDIFEKLLHEQIKHLPQADQITRMNTLKDEKIESLIDVLGISRSSIHFIENYHVDYNYDAKERNSQPAGNNLNIDYHVLKTLGDLISSSEMFILSYLNRSERCLSYCC